MRIRFLTLLVVVFGVRASSQPLVPPYLQAVTTTSIAVLVESDSRDTVMVEFGPTPAYGSRAATGTIEVTTEPTYVHSVTLAGLQPNTRYHYRVHRGTFRSEDASFVTSPLPGTDFRFAWFADCRTNVAVHDSIAARVAMARPAMSLYGGDLCGRSTYASFREEFFRPHQLTLIRSVPFFNAVGNHEGWKENSKAFTEAPASSSGSQAYYSFDYGDMHVLVLNTQIDYSAGSPQYEFASHDLSASRQPWKVVIAHKPAYCAGGHGEDAGMKALTAAVFEPSAVNMVLAGHSHFYQHNVVNGIHHLVIGSAGAPLYTPEQAPYTVRSAKEYDWAIGDVTPTTLLLTVYDERGNVLDSLQLNKKR